MSPEQLKAQRIMILETAISNIGVIIDQVTSTDSDLDTSEIERGLKHARVHLKKKLKELQNA